MPHDPRRYCMGNAGHDGPCVEVPRLLTGTCPGSWARLEGAAELEERLELGKAVAIDLEVDTFTAKGIDLSTSVVDEPGYRPGMFPSDGLARIAELEAALEWSRVKVSTLTAENENASREVAELEGSLELARRRIEGLESGIEASSRAIRNLEALSTSERNKIAELERELESAHEAARQTIVRLERRLEAAIESIDAHEGLTPRLLEAIADPGNPRPLVAALAHLLNYPTEETPDVR